MQTTEVAACHMPGTGQVCLPARLSQDGVHTDFLSLILHALVQQRVKRCGVVCSDHFSAKILDILLVKES